MLIVTFLYPVGIVFGSLGYITNPVVFISVYFENLLLLSSYKNKLMFPCSSFIPTSTKSVIELLNAGTSIPSIVTLVSSYVFGQVNVLARFTSVYFLLSIVAVIGFLSSTLIVTLYVFWLPFCAVTIMSNLLSPSDTSNSPTPVSDAVESSTVAFNLIFSVSLGTLTVYSSFYLSNVPSSS